MNQCEVCGYGIPKDSGSKLCFSCASDQELLASLDRKEKAIIERAENAEREVEKLKKLVRSAYSEGFTDGMGNLAESESWENSQTRMCLKDGFDIYEKEKR